MRVVGCHDMLRDYLEIKKGMKSYDYTTPSVGGFVHPTCISLSGRQIELYLSWCLEPLDYFQIIIYGQQHVHLLLYAHLLKVSQVRVSLKLQTIQFCVFSTNSYVIVVFSYKQGTF